MDGRLPQGFASRLGLRALALQGLCQPRELERNVAGKSSVQIDQTLRLRQPFALHHGDVLADAHTSFRLIGREDAPVIAVLGGISAHRMVAGGADSDGWWPEMVGPGLGVDTRSYR